MASVTSKDVSGGVRIENAKNKRSKWRILKVIVLAVLGVGIMLTGYGCGGGGSEGISVQVVSGVAAAGNSLAGEAAIKDSQGAERTTVIGGDGSFALDITGMRGPFILRAVGTSRGVKLCTSFLRQRSGDGQYQSLLKRTGGQCCED